MKKLLSITIAVCLLSVLLLFLYLKMNQKPKQVNINLGEIVYASNDTEKDSKQVLEEALKGNKPVVLEFYSRWCGSCSQIAPIFDDVQREYSEKAVFIQVDVDEDPTMAGEFKVMYVPTIYAIDAKTKDILLLPAHLMGDSDSFKSVLDQAFNELKPKEEKP